MSYSVQIVICRMIHNIVFTFIITVIIIIIIIVTCSIIIIMSIQVKHETDSDPHGFLPQTRMNVQQTTVAASTSAKIPLVPTCAPA